MRLLRNQIILIGAYDDKTLQSKKTRFSVHGINPTETSRVITIAKSIRQFVGSGTANPVYIQT